MITDYKITEIFCAVDEFCKEFDKVSVAATARPLFPTVRL